MRSFAFILIACGFAFLCAFKLQDAQGLVQKKSRKMPSLFHHVKQAREANIANQIKTEREDKPLTKCEKLRDEALELEKHGAIPAYIPQCKADGSFKPKQCSGSTGYCWCVDKNGNEIPGTQTPPGNQGPQCNKQAEPLTKCEKLHNEALAKKEHGALTMFVPQCREDGSFEPKQCDGSIGYCWCVDKNGDEISGTRTKFGHVPPLECLLAANEKKRTETKCEKLRAEALAKIKEGEMFVLVPECRADGSFNPVQCDQRFSVNFANCWCVDKNGDKIPGTEVTVGFGQSELPTCGDKIPAEQRRHLRG